MLFFLKIFPWITRLSPALVLVKGQWKIISLVLSIATMAGTYLWIGHLNNKIDEAEGNLMLVQDQLVTAQMANDDQMGTIVYLTDANENLASMINVSHAERRAAEQLARDRASQAASELNQTLQELEDLRNENPSCAQISNIDVGAFCPLVVERLRESASAAADSQD